jgi:hypothetical protein
MIATVPQPLDRRRLPWLILAFGLTLASALCGLLYISNVGTVSGWIGLPGYEVYVPRLQRSAGLWSGLAVILPFAAALLLGLGKGGGTSQAETSRTNVITNPELSHEWTAATAVVTYLLRVAISALASLAFMVAYFLVVVLFVTLIAGAH